MIEHINENSISQFLASPNKNVLLVFGATWCGPCKALEPVLNKVLSQYPNVRAGKVDVEESPSVASKYHVQNLPKLILLKQQKYVAERTGFCSEKQLSDFLATGQN